MMQIVFEKRTWDRRTLVVNCSKFLDVNETITGVDGIVADEGALVFGAVTVNTTAVSFPDGSSAAVGKAFQVRVSDGVIPQGQLTLNCTVRAHLVTNIDPRLEATFIVRLNDEAYPT